MSSAAAALILSAAQLHWANVGYTIGEPYGLGLTVSALAWQESSFCEFKRLRWSVGCMGTKRFTVRRIFDPSATRTRLEADNEYSIRAGLAILDYCKGRTKDWGTMLLCYHYGEPDEKLMVSGKKPYDPDSYIPAIRAKVKALQSLPRDTQ